LFPYTTLFRSRSPVASRLSDKSASLSRVQKRKSLHRNAHIAIEAVNRLMQRPEGIGRLNDAEIRPDRLSPSARRRISVPLGSIGPTLLILLEQLPRLRISQPLRACGLQIVRHHMPQVVPPV